MALAPPTPETPGLLAGTGASVCSLGAWPAAAAAKAKSSPPSVATGHAELAEDGP